MLDQNNQRMSKSNNIFISRVIMEALCSSYLLVYGLASEHRRISGCTKKSLGGETSVCICMPCVQLLVTVSFFWIGFVL